MWRVWWVASCFSFRDPPKARFFPPAFSETTGVLRKLQNFSVCGAENDFLVNTVWFPLYLFCIAAVAWKHVQLDSKESFCKCSWSVCTLGTAPFRRNNQAVKKVREIFISKFKYNYVYTCCFTFFIVSALYSCNAISFADAAYSSDLDYVEEHSDTPVTYTATPEGQASWRTDLCAFCVQCLSRMD